MPTTLEESAEAAVFCGDCRKHNLLQIKLAAVRRMQTKKKVAQRERRERLRKYLRALFRTRFHRGDAGDGIAEFLV